MNLLSWLDVERVLAAETQNFAGYPSGISSIRTYDDTLEIETLKGDNQAADRFLKEVFGNRWSPDTSKIQLAYSKESSIDVIISEDAEVLPSEVKPLWRDLGNYTGSRNPKLPKIPSPFPNGTKVIAFHSFKGGVGRTTSLLTWLVALIKQFHENRDKKEKFKVLIVDADLEAPGLTYMFQPQDRPEVSWIQFMEAMLYPPVNNEEVIQYFSDEINRYTKLVEGVDVCILPAYSEKERLFKKRSDDSEPERYPHDMSQLMNLSVRPEHLTRTHDNPWLCSEVLHGLGKKLNADLVLIDLRAGLSELSSPILFDPRIERFVVTTLAEQAVQGTEFILNKLSAMARNPEWFEAFGDTTLHPIVITTFITDEFKNTDRYEESIEKLEASYFVNSQQINDANAAESLEIIEGGFNSEMLHLGNWETALSSIETSNPLLNQASTWAKEFFSAECSLDQGKYGSFVDDDHNDANKLYQLTNQLVYAEKGGSSQLLLTESLRQLAQKHIKTLPLVVSIGAKGSGKTFNYIQLCKKQNWKAFLEEAKVPYSSSHAVKLEKTYILPHFSAVNIEGDAEKAVKNARQSFYDEVSSKQTFSQSKFQQQVREALKCGEINWQEFWEHALIKLHGFEVAKTPDFETLSAELQQRRVQTITIIDGLEELFPEVGAEAQQAAAIKGLLDIPNRLKEIFDVSIGIIIMVREDYVEAVTSQNIGQLKDRYKPYQLLWDAEAFLKLVYWTCHQANLSFAKSPVELRSTREISSSLSNLWGLKLGKNNSREAYSVRWVYAALCDLRGRLQARDIIRFLKYSSEKSLDISREKWTDRVLPPQIIRDVMEDCSKEKIDEATQEFQILGDWIRELKGLEQDKKQVPFASRDVGLDTEQLKKLIELGIIYEDTKKRKEKRYYLPESYRKGLDFTMAGGGRPKVQAMLKSSLGKLPVDL